MSVCASVRACIYIYFKMLMNVHRTGLLQLLTLGVHGQHHDHA